MKTYRRHPYRFSGDRLLKLRIEANLSRMDLCKMINMRVGPDAINCYEHGIYKPGFEVGMELARALEVKPEELFDV